MTKRKKVILGIIVVFLLLAFSGAYYLYSIYSSVSAPINTEKLGANTNLDNKVINIALFGIDGREDEDVEGDRTDVIMIGTLDTKTNSVKLTSVMRDTFVKICIDPEGETATNYAGDQDGIEWEIVDQQTQEVTGEQVPEEAIGSTPDSEAQATERVAVDYENMWGVAEYDKINAAFMDAGVESSILTLNTNFDLNIEDYVTVDFNSVMEVVDALGGIEINIQNEDVLYWTNQFLMESNYYGKRNDPDLTTIGPQTVTGAQALAYVRVRYSDSDYGRSERQREVVQAILDKVKKMDLVTALSVLNRVYPYIKTSLSLGEITEYATKIMNMDDLTFESYRIPGNKDGTSGFLNSIWYLFPDTLVDNNRILHEFIYGGTYTPSNNVLQISQVINDAMLYDATGLTYEIGGEEEEKIQEQKITTEDGQTAESPTEEVAPSP